MDEPEGSAAPDQAIDAGGESPAPAQDAATGEDAPLSMADAFAQAKASTPATETAPESASKDPDGGETAPAGDAGKPPEGRKNQKNEDHSVLRKIATLREQNRIGELDPVAQGELRRLEESISTAAITRHEQTQKEEADFKTAYLDLLAMAKENPAGYRELVRSQPDWLSFEVAYAKAHPEISLESPDAKPAQADPVKVRNEIAATYGRGFEDTIDAIAADGGLSDADLAALKGEFAFGTHPDSKNLSVFLGKMVTALAEKQADTIVAKRLPEVKRAERTAAETAAAVKLGREARPPIHLVDRSKGPGSSSDSSGPISMGEAFRLAKETVSAAS